MLVPHAFLRPIVLYAERWVYRNVDAILTLSPKLSDYVIESGCEKNKVELLPFGVDTSKFNPNVDSRKLKKSLDISDEDPVVVYVGTLFGFSGLDLYVKQFGNVIKEIPTAKLVIVGGGALQNRLEQLVSDLELSNSVLFTGFQPFDLMPQYINLSNVCINPFDVNATTRDIIPGKIIQYLACARPVIATPLPGMMSLLPGPTHGVVYSNIGDFASNTIKLLNDNGAARRLGDNGYRHVKNNHDEREIARRLENTLSQLTNAH
jgi:glycosyltransferase involved in cell wall biosynthesis